jgi:glycosyltransferase involved in cell wall biosynthesis
MVDMPKITAAIITLNEEKRIERCLRSLDWVDEIVVIDSFSADRTVEVCRRYTGKVYQHAWPNNYSEQKSRAHQYAANDWILFIDADEVVTRALRDEIVDLFQKGPDADAFGIPRREYFGGRWIKAGGWYPQHKTILYRKSMGEWVNPIHEKFEVRGNRGYLKNPILHDGYGSRPSWTSSISTARSRRNGRPTRAGAGSSVSGKRFASRSNVSTEGTSGTRAIKTACTGSIWRPSSPLTTSCRNLSSMNGCMKDKIPTAGTLFTGGTP